MAIKASIRSGDVAGVGAWLTYRFGAEFPETMVKKWLRSTPANCDYEDDDTWRMWFFNRIMEDPTAPPIFQCHGESSSGKRAVTCVLHIGFLSVEETPAQLERLRMPDDWLAIFKYATSGIERTLLAAINPINRTAAKVVPQ